MPATCGLACEVCGFPDKGLCPIGRCVAGTDSQAPQKLERFTAAMGHPCLILQCAIKKGKDYCFQCDEFPCTRTRFDENLYKAWVRINEIIRSKGLEKYYELTVKRPRYM